MSKVWHKIDTNKRFGFIRSCKGLKGAKLKGAMKEFVITTFAGLSMDSPDLKSK